MSRTYHVITYGCQMNELESEKIAGILEKYGYTPANTKEDAQLIIVNTCCVRESAEKKILGNIGWLKQLKDEKCCEKIYICGCMIEQDYIREKLKMRYPFVDGVFSTNQLSTLEDILDKPSQNKRIFDLNYSTQNIDEFESVRNTYPLSYVNVMYGCDNFCSYCIVPYVRGRERNRNPDLIYNEILDLKNQGYGEVMLLGQNVNSYGKDTDNNFARLIKKISQTDIPRIRFMTSHPKDLSDELIDCFGDIHNLCPSIHLPVQSGSDNILDSMNRKYTRAHYLDLIKKLRTINPEIYISTDIIVGFPGETEEDFEDTLSLVKEIRFDSAFTFIYSRRSGTKAAEMENQVPLDIKKKRIAELIELQNQITMEKNSQQMGKTLGVLVEKQSKRSENQVCGRSMDNRMVNFSGQSDLIGKTVNVKITKANKTTLLGEITE